MSLHSTPNSSHASSSAFKLPRTTFPEPIIKGVRGWTTPDGWTVLRVHYSADPDADEEWVKDRVVGYRGGTEGRDWQRELEISFESYAGEPVYPRFTSESIRPSAYDPSLELWRGWDFGFRHPAVVFLQYDPETDHLSWLHELYPTLNSEEVAGINTQSLCSLVSAETKNLFGEVYDGAPVRDFVDPSGNQHKETSDYSSIEIMMQHGFSPEWAILGRKNRINYARHWLEDPERFSINPHCLLSVKGLSRAYRYPEDNKGSLDRDMPDLSKRVQNEPYIHLMDAFEYVVANALQLDDVADPSAWSNNEEEQMLIGDLATMYLRSASLAPASNRVDTRMDVNDPWDDYEIRPSDLIGDDDLADAWKVQ